MNGFWRLRLRLSVLAALGLLAATGLLAAPSKAAPTDKPRKAEELTEPEEIKSLRFRNIGPAWGGRVDRAVGVPGEPHVYYLGSASGGLWKSVDGGLAWSPIFDDQPVSTIGSIAVAPSDPNVVYVGTGEANIRGNVQTGAGIWRSLDAGKTWSQVWKQAGQIGTMIVHPKNPDIAFAAVLGDPFGPNPERGVYRTRDGGKTWQQVLKKNADTGASDLAFDLTNPNIVFAGMWEARRRPWTLTSGGPGSGLYVSRDGGDTWKQLTGNGLPGGEWGKVGVAVAPSDGRRVYALIEAEEGGLYRSDDGGENWSYTNGDHQLRQRAFYYMTLTVSPTNPDDVWFPQVGLLHTIDGGKSLIQVTNEHHGDNHDVWMDPRNPRRLIIANDGGVDLSINGGETLTSPELPIGQIYHVSADSRTPFRVAGALQDIGTTQGPSRMPINDGIPNSEWYGVGGGEAGWVVSDPNDPDIVYAGEYGGYISRYDHRTEQTHNVSIYPDNTSGHGGEDLRFRFQWTAPIALSPHDPKALYHGANVLFRSTDAGQSWSQISPDLTRDDKSKEGWAGGPITGDNTGVEVYCTIFVVAESPVTKGVIWAGSDDGLVHVTRDDGKTWRNVTPGMPGLPEWATIAMIEPSHRDAGTAYVTADAHRLDDNRPYLFKTTDYGKTWRRLDGRLPGDIYLHSVREDPQVEGMLYLGTERGVAFSLDDGATWRALRLNLPTVAVHDLVVKANSLALATHGRSMWIFDDLAVLRGLPKAPAGDAVLLPIDPIVRWSYGGTRDANWKGDNATAGAAIHYWLRTAPAGEVTVEILDRQGTIVRTLSSKPREPSGGTELLTQETEQLKKQALAKDKGVQRAVWDLAWDGAQPIVGAKVDTGDPSQGPRALPGEYTVRLTVDGKTTTAPLTLTADPRVRASAAELSAQLDLALQVRTAINTLKHADDRLHSAKQQLASRNGLLKDVPGAKPLIAGSVDLIKKLDALDAKLQNPKAEIVYDILAQKGGVQLYSRLIFLLNGVSDGDAAPTQGMREQFEADAKELRDDLAALSALFGRDLAALNASARQLDVPPIYLPEEAH
jgi:photosystem II stability/assembly factor-like uncharacterized protein